MAIRSATMPANSMSWVTTMAVSQTPVRNSAISSATSRALVGSSPAVGSSKKTTSGSMTSARAMPTRLRMPPESSAGNRPSASDSPTSARKRWTRSVISPSDRVVCSRSGNATFSKTDSESKSAAPWKTKPVRRRRASMASSRMRSIRVPKRDTSPESGRTRPAMILRSTVLPAPLPPITASVVPRWSSRLMPRSTWLASKDFQTSRSSTRGGASMAGSPEQEQEELGQEEVGDDDAHGHLDHRGRRRPPQPLRSSLGGQPVVTADQRDDGAEHHALADAGQEVLQHDPVRDGVPVQVRVDVPVEYRDQHPADEADAVGEDGDDREDEQRRQEPGDDEPLDVVDPERAQGVDLLGHLHGAELGRDARGDLASHEDGREHRSQLSQDRQGHDRAHVVLGPEPGHVDGALQRQHHAGEEGGGERHDQGAHADDVDLARDDPQIGRRQRKVARDARGEQPQPPVPDGGVAGLGLHVLHQRHHGSPAKLSTKTRKSLRPASNPSTGATYRKSWTHRSPLSTTASTATSTPSRRPRITPWAAGRPPTVQVSLSTVRRFVRPKVRCRASTASGRSSAAPPQVASTSMPPGGAVRASSRSTFAPGSARQPSRGSPTW